MDKLKIVLIYEVDEMWSFVMGKKLQRWLWYREPCLKSIIAHAFGDRSTKTLNVLLMRMKQFNVAFLCTDKFKTYSILPKEKHIVGGHVYQHVDIGVKYIFFVEINYGNYRRKEQEPGHFEINTIFGKD